MQTRRRFLRDAAGVAAASALAGCSFANGSGPSGGFLADVVDTRQTVVPSFLTAYTCDPDALYDGLGTDEPLPALGSDLLSNVATNVDGTEVPDLDRLTGQYARQAGHDGGDLQFVRPSASHVLATGDVDADAAAAWLDGLDATTDLGEREGFRRYGADGDVSEAFVVDDRRLGYGNRESVDVAPASIAGTLVEATESAEPVREFAPPVATVADELATDEFAIATRFDLVAERPDTGVDAYDAVAASLLGAGASANVDGSRVRLERALHYRRDAAPSVATVEDALAIAADEGRPLADADWQVRRDDRTVVTEASVRLADLPDRSETLRSAFPIPALADVSSPIDPRTLGRSAPPRVDWQATLVEDRLRLVHGGGPDVEDLVVRYVADGERVEERWPGPVATDDAFTTDRAPDGDSLFDLVWAPRTADETILLRIGL